MELIGCGSIDPQGTLALIFRRDKVLLPLPDRGCHLTLQVDHERGMIDLHLTSDGWLGQPAHQPLFSIARADLDHAMLEVEREVFASLIGAFEPIRVGWMARTRMVPLLGLDVPEDEFASVTRLCRSRGRRAAVIDHELLADRLRIPETYDELLELPVGASFRIFRPSRRGAPRAVGTGFRTTGISRSPWRSDLVWLPDRALRGLMKDVGDRILGSLARHGSLHAPPPWF